MTQAVSGSLPQWTVVSVSPTTQVLAGQPVAGHLVTFQTQHGFQGDAFIPNTVNTVETAQAMIADRVRFIDALSAGSAG